jgi:hypothetical protein
MHYRSISVHISIDHTHNRITSRGTSLKHLPSPCRMAAPDVMQPSMVAVCEHTTHTSSSSSSIHLPAEPHAESRRSCGRPVVRRAGDHVNTDVQGAAYWDKAQTPAP